MAKQYGTSDHGTYRFRVTEEDIARAQQSHSMRCVVVQCIARTIPTATKIEVDISTIRWTNGGIRYQFVTPYTVQGYIIAFDAGDPLEPFAFSLDSRKRIPVRRQVPTEAGKARDAARFAAKRARANQERTEEAARQGKVTPEAVAEATGAADAAYREAARIREATAGQPTKKREGEGQHSAAPRAVPRGGRTRKTAVRSYGHRVLRINQARET